MENQNSFLFVNSILDLSAGKSVLQNYFSSVQLRESSVELCVIIKISYTELLRVSTEFHGVVVQHSRQGRFAGQRFFNKRYNGIIQFFLPCRECFGACGYCEEYQDDEGREGGVNLIVKG